MLDFIYMGFTTLSVTVRNEQQAKNSKMKIYVSARNLTSDHRFPIEHLRPLGHRNRLLRSNFFRKKQHVAINVTN